MAPDGVRQAQSKPAGDDTENVSGTTAELEKASQQMPEIAKSINQIASTSSRYRRWILLSQIFSAVARAFF